MTMLKTIRLLSLLLLLHLSKAVSAYVPAQPSNDTSQLEDDGNSGLVLQLNWQPNGVFRTSVVKSRPNDTSSEPQPQGKQTFEGALFHFTGLNATQSKALTPWIALVSCDSNTTMSASTSPSTESSDVDIFTRVWELGAKAIVAYSLRADTCLLTQEWRDSSVGRKMIDIYTVTSLQNARLIDRQFSNVASSGFWFDSDILDKMGPLVSSTLNATRLVSSGHGRGNNSSSDGNVDTEDAPLKTRSSEWSPSAKSPAPFLTAIVGRANSVPGRPQTDGLDGANRGVSNAVDNGSGNGGGSNNGNTGLAMIILYAITGCVTLLFLLVILSGAVRAIRHPERYGPRAVDPRNPQGGLMYPQSRAQGLTRAILDTFPVVKFGRNSETGDSRQVARDEEAGLEGPKMQENRAKDEENVELQDLHGDAAVAEMVVNEIAVESERDPAPQTPATRQSQASSFVSAHENLTEQNTRESLDGAGKGKGTGLDPDHEASGDSQVPATVIESAARSSSPAVEVGQASTSQAPISSSSPDTPAVVLPNEIDNSAICPICVEPWQDGDDIRILPCDGRHRFHQDCIDPWLLNVSSLCPLCRLDLSGTGSGQVEEGSDTNTVTEQIPESPTTQPPENRRSLLRSLINRRSSHDPTQPSSPLATNAPITWNNTEGPGPGFTASKFMKYISAVRKGGNRRSGAHLAAATVSRRDRSSQLWPPVEDQANELPPNESGSPSTAQQWPHS